jgi:hypothetical protein
MGRRIHALKIMLWPPRTRQCRPCRVCWLRSGPHHLPAQPNRRRDHTWTLFWHVHSAHGKVNVHASGGLLLAFPSPSLKPSSPTGTFGVVTSQKARTVRGSGQSRGMLLVTRLLASRKQAPHLAVVCSECQLLGAVAGGSNNLGQTVKLCCFYGKRAGVPSKLVGGGVARAMRPQHREDGRFVGPPARYSAVVYQQAT